jgi:hypothetical protein
MGKGNIQMANEESAPPFLIVFVILVCLLNIGVCRQEENEFPHVPDPRNLC